MRWALLLALLSTSALASRADRLSVSPRLDRRDRLGASSAASPILLSLSLLPPDSECSGTPPDGVTFTRASGATCIASTGIAYALASNQARTHATLGLLVEGPATNEALYSRNVANAVWGDGDTPATCTANDVLGMDMSTLVATCTSGTVAQFSAPATGSRTFSAYVKTGASCPSGTATLEADAASTTVAIGSVWKRIVLPYTSDGDVLLAITGSCQFVVDYVQDEAGGFATSPIATAGTAVSRAGDVANIPDPGLSTVSGCAAMDVTPLFSAVAGPGGGYYLSAAGGANSRIGYNVGAGNQWRVFDGTSPVFVAAGYVAGTPKRYRTEWEPGRVQAFNVTDAVDGSPGSFAAFGTSFSGGLSVGHSVSSSQAFAHLRSLVLGPTPEACQ